MNITADDLTYCREIARREQYPFYLISLFAPEITRQAWWGLLAFQAELAKIHHTVTNPLAGQIRLQWWRDTIGQCLAGKPPSHPVARILAEVIKQFKLALAPFEILIDAREDDFGDAPTDANCLANYGRATTVPLLQLLLACEGLDIISQGKYFSWVDAIGTQWGQLQALTIWPQLTANLTTNWDVKKIIAYFSAFPAINDKPYLSLLFILLKAEYAKLKRVSTNPDKASKGYGVRTLLKLLLAAKHCGQANATHLIKQSA